jgi:hypothetical protein
MDTKTVLRRQIRAVSQTQDLPKQVWSPLGGHCRSVRYATAVLARFVSLFYAAEQVQGRNHMAMPGVSSAHIHPSWLAFIAHQLSLTANTITSDTSQPSVWSTCSAWEQVFFTHWPQCSKQKVMADPLRSKEATKAVSLSVLCTVCMIRTHVMWSCLSVCQHDWIRELLDVFGSHVVRTLCHLVLGQNHTL